MTVALIILSACKFTLPDLPAGMVCPNTYGGRSVVDVLDELDINKDGVFNHEDVKPGVSVLVFRFVQADGKERLVVSRDAKSRLLHQNYIADGETIARDELGVWHEFLECSASGWITPWFLDEDPKANPFRSGPKKLVALAFDISEIEHGNINVEPELDAVMHIVKIGRGFSGYFEGEASTDIITYFTQEKTGEHGEIVAHAFRDLPVLTL